jgi:hypothetical protein
MDDFRQQAQQWLDREDVGCRQGRIDRLVWLASALPGAEYLTFPGGWIAKHLYEEARYCFVYAQFLAAIVLGFAFVERTLAAMFYAAGRNDLQRVGASVLFREAVALGWMSQEEHDWLERAREVRNPVTHFRRPGHEDTMEYRCVTEQELPYAIIEEDARHVMVAAMRLLGRGAV